MNRIATLAFVSLLAGPIGSAQAALVISFQDATFQPGELGSIDVLISSNSNDQLGRFSALFEIEYVSGVGVLEFQASRTSADANRQSNSERSQANYVFAGNLDPNGFVSNRTTNTRLLQFDRALSDVAVGDMMLLGRLELQHILPPTVTGDGEYQVRMLQDAFTSFELLDRTVITVAPESFTNFGRVRTTAVPEPSAMVCVSMVALAAGLSRRRTRHA